MWSFHHSCFSYSFSSLVISGQYPFVDLGGNQISNRILDAGVLPLLGVTLLRTACFLESGVDSRRDPVAAKRLLRQRESARRLIRIGIGSLLLLAIWQLPLFIGSLNLIDQQRMFESRQLSDKLTTAEQALRQASQAMVDETWKQFVVAGLSSSRQIIRDREHDARQCLSGSGSSGSRPTWA